MFPKSKAFKWFILDLFRIFVYSDPVKQLDLHLEFEPAWKCPRGSELINGLCHFVVKGSIKCPEGFTYFAFTDECFQLEAGPVIKIEDKIEEECDKNYYCANGYELLGDSCVAKLTIPRTEAKRLETTAPCSLRPGCPDGWIFSLGTAECIKLVLIPGLRTLESAVEACTPHYFCPPDYFIADPRRYIDSDKLWKHGKDKVKYGEWGYPLNVKLKPFSRRLYPEFGTSAFRSNYPTELLDSPHPTVKAGSIINFTGTGDATLGNFTFPGLIPGLESLDNLRNYISPSNDANEIWNKEGIRRLQVNSLNSSDSAYLSQNYPQEAMIADTPVSMLLLGDQLENQEMMALWNSYVSSSSTRITERLFNMSVYNNGIDSSVTPLFNMTTDGTHQQRENALAYPLPVKLPTNASAEVQTPPTQENNGLLISLNRTQSNPTSLYPIDLNYVPPNSPYLQWENVLFTPPEDLEYDPFSKETQRINWIDSVVTTSTTSTTTAEPSVTIIDRDLDFVPVCVHSDALPVQTYTPSLIVPCEKKAYCPLGLVDFNGGCVAIQVSDGSLIRRISEEKCSIMPFCPEGYSRPAAGSNQPMNECLKLRTAPVVQKTKTTEINCRVEALCPDGYTSCQAGRMCCKVGVYVEPLSLRCGTECINVGACDPVTGCAIECPAGSNACELEGIYDIGAVTCCPNPVAPIKLKCPSDCHRSNLNPAAMCVRTVTEVFEGCDDTRGWDKALASKLDVELLEDQELLFRHAQLSLEGHVCVVRVSTEPLADCPSGCASYPPLDDALNHFKSTLLKTDVPTDTNYIFNTGYKRCISSDIVYGLECPEGTVQCHNVFPSGVLPSPPPSLANYSEPAWPPRVGVSACCQIITSPYSKQCPDLCVDRNNYLLEIENFGFALYQPEDGGPPIPLPKPEWKEKNAYSCFRVLIQRNLETCPTGFVRCLEDERMCCYYDVKPLLHGCPDGCSPPHLQLSKKTLMNAKKHPHLSQFEVMDEHTAVTFAGLPTCGKDAIVEKYRCPDESWFLLNNGTCARLDRVPALLECPRGCVRRDADVVWNKKKKEFVFVGENGKSHRIDKCELVERINVGDCPQKYIDIGNMMCERTDIVAAFWYCPQGCIEESLDYKDHNFYSRSGGNGGDGNWAQARHDGWCKRVDTKVTKKCLEEAHLSPDESACLRITLQPRYLDCNVIDVTGELNNDPSVEWVPSPQLPDFCFSPQKPPVRPLGICEPPLGFPEGIYIDPSGVKWILSLDLKSGMCRWRQEFKDELNSRNLK